MGSGALPQEDLSVYAAQSLLRGTIPARLAYTSTDGTPRVVPIWFHWTGEEFVIGTPAAAPKLKALKRDPRVALTIDQDDFPAQVLLVRRAPRPQGDGRVVPEYALAARRYLGEEQGLGWVARAEKMFPKMVRISVRPNGSACSTFSSDS